MQIMQIRLQKHFFGRAALFTLLALTIALPGRSAQAAGVFVSIAFDQSSVTIGRTPRLAISISNQEANSIRSTKFVCISQGTSLSASSISQLPAVIAANSTFTTEQYYRAASPGTTQVHCELTAINTITGAQITAVSPTLSVDVLAEQRLYFNAYSATHVATVGQAVFVNALFGNRGHSTFTNLDVSCPELGRSLVFISRTPLQSSLPSGQSGFVQYQLKAVRPGFGPIVCSLTATDSSTGIAVTLLAPTVNIEVR